MTAPDGPVDRLRAAALRFGGDWAKQKAELLDACAALPLSKPDELLAYHDTLLFLLAYPENTALRAHAARELRRVVGAARAIAGGPGARRKRALEGSGIAWS